MLELADCTATLLHEIDAKETTRASLAPTYAMAIRSGEAVDWRKVNRAIMDRWSLSALTYIKTKAWRKVESR